MWKKMFGLMAKSVSEGSEERPKVLKTYKIRKDRSWVSWEIETSQLPGRMISIAWIDEMPHDAVVLKYDDKENQMTLVYSEEEICRTIKEKDLFEYNWGVYSTVGRKYYSKYPPGTVIGVEDKVDGKCYEAMVYEDGVEREGKLYAIGLNATKYWTLSMDNYPIYRKSPSVKWI